MLINEAAIRLLNHLVAQGLEMPRGSVVADEGIIHVIIPKAEFSKVPDSYEGYPVEKLCAVEWGLGNYPDPKGNCNG